jgi:fused signal recognition particle receptor
MFGFLKKKLSESVEKLSDKIKGKEETPKAAEPKMETPVGKPQAKIAMAADTEAKVKERPRAQAPKKETKTGKKAAPKKDKKSSETPAPIKPMENERGAVEEPFEKPDKLSVEPSKKTANIEKTAKIEKVEPKKPGLMDRLTGRVLERKIAANDIDSLFEEMEIGLMEANVTLETIDFLRSEMKKFLVDRQLRRGDVEKEIRATLERILLEIFDQGAIELDKLVRTKKPVCVVFLGFNGSGKTTSIAKLGQYLKSRKFQVVLAAGDTWRSAAIEQLEVHGDKLGIKVIKHEYGADSAAVIYDAIEHAKAKDVDFVLADTAGRSHSNKNLMDELKKVVRVNKPELKILVMDSLAGNDLVEQARNFDAAVGVDAMIFTKTDVNEKGGGMLSACLAVKKPILYIGTGQEYDDIELFDAKKFVKDLMEGG